MIRNYFVSYVYNSNMQFTCSEICNIGIELDFDLLDTPTVNDLILELKLEISKVKFNTNDYKLINIISITEFKN